MYILKNEIFENTHRSAIVASFRLINILGNSLAVQWLGLCLFTAKGVGSIPGQGTKIMQAVRCSQKKILIPVPNSAFSPQCTYTPT